MAHHLRFRQIHLDFHTSGNIPGIGLGFDKEEWIRTLKDAHVNSITLFAKCHHGWHYHDTKVGRMHPSLGFDLLRAQFDACKEADINAPIYISAGYDDVTMMEHPGWKNIFVNPKTMEVTIPSNLKAGFHRACFNSPYLEHLVAEIKEVLQQFPNCNGIFLDIIKQPVCACEHCMKVMRENGLDPTRYEDLVICQQMAQERYFKLTTKAVMDFDPEMPIFHNAGHVKPGNRALLNEYFSHLEIESLPTGGWGYDHYPLAAKYAQTVGMDHLGMTGKFHTTWGEFGGYKHPNALRYECAAMLAYGSKCSIGDQLHPSGKLDSSTYRIIGKAYSEVEAKEAWCDRVNSIADIAILPRQAIEKDANRDEPGDVGAGRLLLEGHFLFDIIDLDVDFAKYRLLVLPDAVPIDAKLKKRLDAYLAKGGRLLLTGTSGLDANGQPLFELGAKFEGLSPFSPDYLLPIEKLQPPDVDSPMVMYLPGQRMKVTKGTSLGVTYDSYFNRTDHYHFCSHQQTPYPTDASGFDSGVQFGNIVYLAHPMFAIYRGWGCVPVAQYLRKVVSLALGEQPRLICNLPSAARVTMMDQPSKKRSIVHLLYAGVVARGGAANVNGVPVRGNGMVIEELLPLHGTRVKVKPLKEVRKATLEPQGIPMLVEREDDGYISFLVDSFTCHQMVVLHY